MSWIKRMFGIGRAQRQERRELVEMAIAAHERRLENAKKGIRTNVREMETMRGMVRMMKGELEAAQHEN